MLKFCPACEIPVIDHDFCPLCNSKLKKFYKDARPVFPEERNLLEVLLNVDSLSQKSVWASGVYYFFDGVSHHLPSKIFKNSCVDDVRKKLATKKIDYSFFNLNIQKFINANSGHLLEIEIEAKKFIHDQAFNFENNNIIVSFSGGKDSTVISHLVMNSIENLNPPHIFADTTIETQSTLNFIDRFKKDHPNVNFLTARNYDSNFFDEVKFIGAPSRNMRWCHLFFKNSILERSYRKLYNSEVQLQFCGVRANESAVRATYPRSRWFLRLKSGYPILHWLEADVWLYLFYHNLDFCDDYRKGFSRVGCFCCPCTSDRSVFLARLFYPEKQALFDNALLEWLKNSDVKDIDHYIEAEVWKGRLYSRSSKNSECIKIEKSVDENQNIRFNLKRKFSTKMKELFLPFGNVVASDGNSFFVKNENEVLFKVNPSEDFLTVKIETKVKPKYLERKIGYQVRKWNACRACLKCESVCDNNAISVSKSNYKIDANKCTHCGKCITAKNIVGGCMMSFFLLVKKHD